MVEQIVDVAFISFIYACGCCACGCVAWAALAASVGLRRRTATPAPQRAAAPLFQADCGHSREPP